MYSSELYTGKAGGRKYRQVTELLEANQQITDLQQPSTLVDQINKEIPRVQRNPGRFKSHERG